MPEKVTLHKNKDNDKQLWISRGSRFPIKLLTVNFISLYNWVTVNTDNTIMLTLSLTKNSDHEIHQSSKH